MKFFRFFICLIIILSFKPVNAKTLDQSPKTILITGAAGFIGSNFLVYMYDKYPSYHFIVLDALTYAGSMDRIPKHIQESPRYEFIHNTINNALAVDAAMAKSQMVVHFAAESHVTRSIYDDELFFFTDVMGTRVLMNSARKFSQNIERFVHISTSEVYGTAEWEPMDENHPLNPRSPYAAAKAGADRLVYSYCCTYNVPAVILRPFNNYGPGQHLEKLIPRLIASAFNKEPLKIHGTGLQTRDWVYTLDIAKAIDTVLHLKNFDSIKHQVINLGSGKSTSVLEIAHMILKHFGLPPSYIQFTGDRLGQVECHISSTEKAKTLLNWSATTDFNKGIEETITWYMNHPHIWEKMMDDMVLPIQAASGKIEDQ